MSSERSLIFEKGTLEPEWSVQLFQFPLQRMSQYTVQFAKQTAEWTRSSFFSNQANPIVYSSACLMTLSFLTSCFCTLVELLWVVLIMTGHGWQIWSTKKKIGPINAHLQCYIKIWLWAYCRPCISFCAATKIPEKGLYLASVSFLTVQIWTRLCEFAQGQSFSFGLTCSL